MNFSPIGLLLFDLQSSKVQIPDIFNQLINISLYLMGERGGGKFFQGGKEHRQGVNAPLLHCDKGPERISLKSSSKLIKVKNVHWTLNGLQISDSLFGL